MGIFYTIDFIDFASVPINFFRTKKTIGTAGRLDFIGLECICTLVNWPMWQKVIRFLYYIYYILYIIIFYILFKNY